MEVLNAAIRFVIAVIRWGHGKGRQVGMVALVIDLEPQFAKTGGNPRSGLPTLFLNHLDRPTVNLPTLLG